jgi:universal stress protein A
MFKRILLAADFSSISRAALDVAAKLAAEQGAELIIAHVWEIPVYATGELAPFPPQIVNDVVTAAERVLVEWRDVALTHGVKQVSTLLRNGAPWHELVETIAADTTIDLLVIGTHGRTGIKHVLLGSVAEKVVRHARCAVLVSRGTA